MLAALASAGAEVYGVVDPNAVRRRVPTFCFNLPGVAPAAVALGLAEAGIGARDGHMYAPRLMERLGLALDRGAVRASLVHYNSFAEIDRFAEGLRALARRT
jgi:selenocysteine lyase/cysteine desulfurase